MRTIPLMLPSAFWAPGRVMNVRPRAMSRTKITYQDAVTVHQSRPRSAVGQEAASADFGRCGFSGDLILPDRWLGLGPSTAVIPDVASDGLDDACSWYGQKRAQDPGQLDRQQDGEQNRQRVELHGAGQDDRL